MALGLVHGPAELLPISSSGHTTVVPWLLGWSYPELDPEVRKALEVALHAGAAAALLIVCRQELRDELGALDRRRLAVIAAGSAPAAAAGYLLEGWIELRLGRPSTIAGGLLAGSLALVVADRAPQRRGADEAGAVDGLWLGLAQACALVPGISRNGATLAAGRLRGFRRGDAEVLSRRLAFPVIIGATLLKARRLGPRRRIGGAPLAVGAVASFASTLAASRWSREADERPLLPYAAYRTALAATILIRLRRGSTAARRPSAPR